MKPTPIKRGTARRLGLRPVRLSITANMLFEIFYSYDPFTRHHGIWRMSGDHLQQIAELCAAVEPETAAVLHRGLTASRKHVVPYLFSLPIYIDDTVRKPRLELRLETSE